MKSRFATLLVVCCILFAGAVYALAGNVAQDTGDQAATKWEHLALRHDSSDVSRDLSRRINSLGDEGWELVDVSMVVDHGTTEKTVFYFKRPK